MKRGTDADNHQVLRTVIHNIRRCSQSYQYRLRETYGGNQENSTQEPTQCENLPGSVIGSLYIPLAETS